MRLTMMSDYALRVLLFAAAHPDRLVTIDETQEVYDISRGHLMKIIGVLARAGILR
jgi:Rrf2 family nitric oxide-sensitive transcriptional repressor